MIRIACTNCKTVLSIDDAFAGGVCRCQHCGTIQTVPATAKSAAGVGAATGQSKALYQHGRTPDNAGTGLDDLATALSSSGLTGSGLTSRRLTKTSAPSSKNMMPMFIGIGVLIVALLGIIIWLATRSSDTRAVGSASGDTNPSQTSSGDNHPAPAKSGPNFCGVPISGNVVTYLLDRGSSTTEVFGALKDVTLKSAMSLGTDHKFQIIFWNNGSDVSYPMGSPTYCTKENVEAASRVIDDVSAYGASDITPALQKAIIASPDVIIIATAKGPDLDDTWTHDVMAMRGSSPAKFVAVSMGSNSTSAALKSIASQSGGTYKEVNSSDLKEFMGQP